MSRSASRPRQGAVHRRLRRWALLAAALTTLTVLSPWLAPHPAEEQIDPAVTSLRPPLTHLAIVEIVERPRPIAADAIEQNDRTWTLERQGRHETVSPESVVRLEWRRYWLGTDRIGRDLLSRVILGARVSLTVGVLAALLALFVGTLVGSLAALGPPWLDDLLMRSVDALRAFPQLLLLLLLAMLYRPTTLGMVLLLGVTSWLGLARLVRAEIRTLSEQEYVLAARSLGLTTWSIFTRHLLPGAVSTILVATTLLVADAILAETALSFLGLSGNVDAPSWGRMLAEGSSDLARGWWMSTFPGIAVTVTIVIISFLGDALRDALDPYQA